MFTRGFCHALFHGRPLTVPLLYWLLETDGNIILFQKVFYFLSSVIIACIIGFTLRRSVFRVLATLIIFLSLFDREYLFWNHAILSESISISLVLLFLSIIICAYIYEPHSYLFWLGSIILTFFMVGARDVHAYLVFVIALLSPFLLIKKFGIKKGVTRSLIACTFLICLGLWQDYNAQINKRYLFSLVNVMNKRILPYQERIDYFRKYNFPYNEEVLKLRGKWASECDWGVLEPWLSNHGKSVYMKFLLENYTYTLGEVYKRINTLINPELFRTHSSKISPLESVHPKMYYLSFFKINFTILLIDFFIISFILLLKKENRVYLPLAILLLGLSHMIICYHGDAMEFERHCLMSSLIINIGFLYALFIFLEKIRINLMRKDTSLFRLHIHMGYME